MKLSQLNTNLNLFTSLYKKSLSLFNWLKARKLLSLSLIIVLAVGGYFIYQRLRPKALSELYQLAPVVRTDITQTVIASGRVKAANQVDLKFQTSGLLTWVGVKEGDQVKKWQALASLDKRQLNKTLQQELIDFSKERLDYDEDQKVTYRDRVLTDTISRVLAKNEHDLSRAVLDVEIQDLAIKLATLTTPIAGIVTRVDVPVAGVNITPATAVFTVADPDSLVFEADIDETDIGPLTEGQSAALILDAYPNQPINLTLDRIDFNATIDSGGATIYQIEFNLPQTSNLRLGLNGEVTIVVAQKQNVLAAPYSAISSQNEVRVVRGNQLETVTVETGANSEDMIEIISGLNEGDQVVL